MSSTIIDTLKNAFANLFHWESAQEEAQNNTNQNNNKPPQQQPHVRKINSQLYPTGTNDNLSNPPPPQQSLSIKPQPTGAKTQTRKPTPTPSVVSYIKNYLMEEQVQCIVCLYKFRKPGVVRFCLCEHSTCSICLKEYINAKLNGFVMPKCPEQACLANIDKQTGFFRSLNQKTRLLFDKVEKFYFISNDPFLKMCPNQNCHGIIPVINDQPYQCLQCQNQFCKKCMYFKHKGKCTKNQALILNMKYNFTKCDQCGIIVQKTEACDHMTCKCGYQFCYRCGRKWVGAHHCNPPVKRKNDGNNGNGSQDSGKCLNGLLFAIQLLSFLLLLPFMVVFYFLLVMIVFLLGVFVGITFYSLVVIIRAGKKYSIVLALLLIILYPIAMIIGVFTAFKQYWGEKVYKSMRLPFEAMNHD